MFASDLRRSGGRFGSASRHLEGFTPVRQGSSGGAAPVGDASQEQRIAERAKLYESALQKSIAIGSSSPAAHRRTPSGAGTLKGTVADAGSGTTTGPREIDVEDTRSDIEESYIDGATRHAGGGMDQGGYNVDRNDEDELADGGVMGLLTQIYDNRRRAI